MDHAGDAMNKSDRAGESGIVLVIVIILAGVAAILGGSLYLASRAASARAEQAIRFERAFLIAEAGAERAKAELRDTTLSLGMILAGADGATNTADDGVLAFGAAVPFGGGEYRVRVRDNADSNPSLFVDTDRTVIIRSTGMVEQVQRVLDLTVVVSNLLAPPAAADGALADYGTNTEVQIGGSSLIDGRDYDLPAAFNCSGSGCNGTPTTNAAAPGLYSAGTTMTYAVSAPAQILGTPPVTNNAPGIHSASYYDSLVDALIPLATITIPGGVLGGNVTLGTRASPQITLVTGDAKITGNVDGAGIMIITAGVEIDFTGTFHFEGLVIIVGDNVNDAAAEFNDKGNAKIFGSLVALGGQLDLKPKGSPSIMFSRAALANLANLPLPPGDLSVQNWREVK